MDWPAARKILEELFDKDTITPQERDALQKALERILILGDFIECVDQHTHKSCVECEALDRQRLVLHTDLGD